MGHSRKNPEDFEPLIAPELRSAVAPFEHSQTIINEAEFGYRYIREYLLECSAGSRVLEVGSGPCVLLSQLKIDFPDLEIMGIEPIGPGFDNFEGTLQQLTDKFGFELQKSPYEDLEDTGRFDFIFLVNVFEHLPDWRHFLKFVAAKLQSDGKCVILCPNYGFPYEPHFGLPIVLNKSLTYRIFKAKIMQCEEKNGWSGLWESLNLVKWNEVRKWGPNCGLQICFIGSILRDMVERFQYDKEFAQRQRRIGCLARLILRCGALRLFEKPFFNRINPYMFLEITPSEASRAPLA